MVTAEFMIDYILNWWIWEMGGNAGDISFALDSGD